MRIGRLDAVPALTAWNLRPGGRRRPSRRWERKLPADAVGVAEIDPELADTAAFCDRYDVALREVRLTASVGQGGATARQVRGMRSRWPRTGPMSTAWSAASSTCAGVLRPVDVAVAQTAMSTRHQPEGVPGPWPAIRGRGGPAR